MFRRLNGFFVLDIFDYLYQIMWIFQAAYLEVSLINNTVHVNPVSRKINDLQSATESVFCPDEALVLSFVVNFRGH